MANSDYDGKKPNRVNKTSYKTKYPYNQAFLSEAGHEIHVDNTPGKERIRIAHKSGSYMEISPDGRRVDFSVGNHQDYRKGGWSLTVDENGDTKISGHNRLNVAGGSHITVKGNADVVIGGNSNQYINGNMNAGVAGNAWVGVNKNMNMHVNGNMHMKVAGSTLMETKGKHTVIADGGIYLNP